MAPTLPTTAEVAGAELELHALADKTARDLRRSAIRERD
eukprot:COSAG05_NODE_12847_length_452_cov_0.696884_1_plen_38_part_01